MRPDTITIFEIPLILDLICASLDKADWWRCRRTCKLWDQLFSPHAWEDVQLQTRRSESSTWISSKRSTETQDGIRQKASWIRTLWIGVFDSIFEGSVTCNRLHHITFVAYYTSKPNRDIHGAAHYVATDLIRQNPFLRSIRVVVENHADQYIHQPVLTALMALRNLQKLELESGHLYNVTMVEAIVRHCPDSLVDLSITSFYNKSPTAMTALPSGISFPAWRTLPNLRRLTVGIEVDVQRYPERSLLIPLLQQNPNVTDLDLNLLVLSDHLSSQQLTDILIAQSYHPGIRRLRLPQRRALRQEDILRILKECRNLVELEFFYGADYGPQVFKTLIRNSGRTLEVLRFTDEMGSVVDHKMDRIPMVLRNCPRLKVLESIPRLYGVNAGVSLHGLTWKPWVAKELETLKITIRDDNSEWPEIKERDLEDSSEEEEDEQDGFDFKAIPKGLVCRGRATPEGREAWKAEIWVLLDKLAGYLKGNPRLDTLRLRWVSRCYRVEKDGFCERSKLSNERPPLEHLDRKTFDRMRIPHN